MIELLPDGSFHLDHLPQDDIVVVVITDVLSTGSHSLFEMLNKISDCGASHLYIDLSSSTLSMEETAQCALNEQLSIILARFFPFEFTRYRAVDEANMPHAKNLLLNNMDARHCLATDPLTLTT